MVMPRVKKKKAIKIVEGNPQYIDWCIYNSTAFHIEPSEIVLLENMEVFRFRGIKAIHNHDDIYNYEPLFSTIKYKFRQETINKNKEKFERFHFPFKDDFDEDCEPNDEYDMPAEECACGEWPCACSDRDN